MIKQLSLYAQIYNVLDFNVKNLCTKLGNYIGDKVDLEVKNHEIQKNTVEDIIIFITLLNIFETINTIIMTLLNTAKPTTLHKLSMTV